MPTKNIKDVRGYMDVAYLFIDEADHFDKSIQEELRTCYYCLRIEEQEKYEKLIVGLRTAYAKEYSLDKEQTSYDDSIDALRLALKGYKIN